MHVMLSVATNAIERLQRTSSTTLLTESQSAYTQTGETLRPASESNALTQTAAFLCRFEQGSLGEYRINFEQPLNDWIGILGRWGWNEGQHESYAYTEVDETVLLGVGGNGARWKRKLDRIGIAFVTNGISRDHREYLALGGDGFILGDGKLNYDREKITEAYYTLHVWRGIYASFDFQYVANPGYNRDRGPVIVPALRLHLEL